MMKRAFKTILHSIGAASIKHTIKPVIDAVQPVEETSRIFKQGKGKDKKAHKPTGIVKAKRAAKKMRNKQRSK